MIARRWTLLTRSICRVVMLMCMFVILLERLVIDSPSFLFVMAREADRRCVALTIHCNGTKGKIEDIAAAPVSTCELTVERERLQDEDGN